MPQPQATRTNTAHILYVPRPLRPSTAPYNSKILLRSFFIRISAIGQDTEGHSPNPFPKKEQNILASSSRLQLQVGRSLHLEANSVTALVRVA